MNRAERPWYFWPLIAFVVGLLIGWLLIGWLLWPVTWTNATLRDLQPGLRNQYVTMVAESYAQTRNLQAARDRLSGWSQDELAQVMADWSGVLVARGEMATAQNVRELATALGVTQVATAGEGTQGQTQPQPTQQPSAAPAGLTSTLRTICTAGLFILLALGALALLAYLFRRWRATQAITGAVEAEPDFDALDARTAAAVAEQEKARWPERDTFIEEDITSRRPYVPSSSDIEDSERDDGIQPRTVTPEDSPSIPLRPVGPAPRTPSFSEPSEPRTPSAPAPLPSEPPASGELHLLTENTAVYQMGEPDYDEAFDINDPIDGYMGQCGLQLIEPFGRDRDQAVALQVWLWDSSDPDTQALVLMSEGAYRDTSLRSQHSGEHQTKSVRPGMEFELASHDLLLRGRVEKVSYAEMEPLRGVFAELDVKMSVYRRS